MTNYQFNVWILGLNFLSNYYTVFDQENGLVGISQSIFAVPKIEQLNNESYEYELLYNN